MGVPADRVPEQPPQVPAGQPQPDQRVPIDRLNAVTSKAKAAEDKAARLEKENLELRRKAAQVDHQAKIQAFMDGTDSPKGFDSWEPERQERWKMQRQFELLQEHNALLTQDPEPQPAPKGKADAPPQPTGGLSDEDRQRLEAIELRQRFGQLSDQQVEALRAINGSRRPQNEQELLALAQINYPQLFGHPSGTPPGGQQGLPPGRGAAIPSQNREVGAADLGAMLDQMPGSMSRSNRIGGALLDAVARENPGLLFNGR